jgi:pimeloyl-ACP methyl ester carboxylesterase
MEKTIDQFIYSGYNLLPENWKDFLGETLWNLHVKSQYFLSSAKENSLEIDGLDISYAEIGDPRLKKLVIIHGFSDSKESFLGLAGKFSNEYHVLIPDLPGFGKSAKPNITYSIDFYAKILKKFLEQKGVQGFHSLGNSLGGAILVEYLNQFPGEIDRLVLVNSAGYIPEADGDNLYTLYKNGKNLFEIDSETDFQEFLDRLFHSLLVVPAPVRYYLFQKYRANKKWYSKLMDELLGTFIKTGESIARKEQQKKLEGVNVPTLVVWGESDGFFPENIAHGFKKTIQQSELTFIPKAGHLPHMEKTKDVYRATIQFFRKFS